MEQNHPIQIHELRKQYIAYLEILQRVKNNAHTRRVVEEQLRVLEDAIETITGSG
jgi:hypothetical protein